MSQQPTTQALGSTTFVLGWVEDAQVQELIHASDGFQVLVAISLTCAGASVAAAVALGAGALHPIAMYLVLCGLLVATLISGSLTVREYLRYRRVRRQLANATVKVPVPLMLVTPGWPSFTAAATTAAGGQTQVALTQQPVYNIAPGTVDVTSGGQQGEAGMRQQPDPEPGQGS